MTKPGIILIGAGGHARACIDVIEQQGQYQIAGLVGMAEEVGTHMLGYPVIATDAELPALVNSFAFALVTVGQIESPDRRLRIYREASRLGFTMASIIAPSAYVSAHASIGAGTVVMHRALVNAGARVGQNCIINTRALVEHDAQVDDDCHIATGAILNGAVQVGAGSFVGSGAIVKQGVRLGQRCIIGMGQALRHHQPDHARVIG